MLHQKLRELLEVNDYRDILIDAVIHYKNRLSNLPKMDIVKDFITHQIAGEFEHGIILEYVNELDILEEDELDKIFNALNNKEILIDVLKDAVNVYYQDSKKSYEFITKELGFIPSHFSHPHTQNDLDYVYNTLRNIN